MPLDGIRPDCCAGRRGVEKATLDRAKRRQTVGWCWSVVILARGIMFDTILQAAATALFAVLGIWFLQWGLRFGGWVDDSKEDKSDDSEE